MRCLQCLLKYLAERYIAEKEAGWVTHSAVVINGLLLIWRLIDSCMIIKDLEVCPPKLPNCGTFGKAVCDTCAKVSVLVCVLKA